MTLTPALTRELASARPRLNAQVAAARRARAGFDTAALSQAVATRLDPLVAAVDRIAPDRARAVTEAGFELIVTLVTQGLAGARSHCVNRVWKEVAVALAAAVATRPAPCLAMLTNAALTLQATSGARVDEWMQRMAALAPLIDADTMAGAGQVVAWRSGMAHYRTGALAAADLLPEPLALAAIGAGGRWSEVRAALTANRWWTPDDPAPSIRFGGFVGFGGPFEAPPEVRATPEGFVLRFGERHGFLTADAWGATLHPAAPEEFASATPSVASAGRATNLPGDDLRAAFTTDSVIFGSPISHFVEVQPWRG